MGHLCFEHGSVSAVLRQHDSSWPYVHVLVRSSCKPCPDRAARRERGNGASCSPATTLKHAHLHSHMPLRSVGTLPSLAGQQCSCLCGCSLPHAAPAIAAVGGATGEETSSAELWNQLRAEHRNSCDHCPDHTPARMEPALVLHAGHGTQGQAASCAGGKSSPVNNSIVCSLARPACCPPCCSTCCCLQTPGVHRASAPTMCLRVPRCNGCPLVCAQVFQAWIGECIITNDDRVKMEEMAAGAKSQVGGWRSWG